MPYTPRAPGSPPKLLVSDIDGTLIHGDEDPSPELIRAIQDAQASGLKIALASGRNSVEVLWFLDQLEIKGEYIALGGAYAGDSTSSEVLLDERLPIEIVTPLLELAQSNNLNSMLEFPDELIFFGDSDLYSEIEQMVKASKHTHEGWEHQWRGQAPAKIILIGDDSSLSSVVKDLSKHDDTIEYSLSRDRFLDVTRKGANKGHAIRIVADHCGVPIEQVVAIGDGWNDKSMFEVAGFSFAMGTGDKNLHRFADIVTPPSRMDGFKWALERIVAWMESGSRG